LLALTAVGIALSAACSKEPATLDKAEARRVVEESPAFTGPWDPQMLFDGVAVERDPAWKRKVIAVDAVQVFGTGLSASARAAFTWKWEGGPLDGASFESVAILVHRADGWAVDEVKLRNALWKAEQR
jgi:hypothetical protein